MRWAGAQRNSEISHVYGSKSWQWNDSTSVTNAINGIWCCECLVNNGCKSACTNQRYGAEVFPGLAFGKLGANAHWKVWLVLCASFEPGQDQLRPIQLQSWKYLLCNTELSHLFEAKWILWNVAVSQLNAFLFFLSQTPPDEVTSPLCRCHMGQHKLLDEHSWIHTHTHTHTVNAAHGKTREIHYFIHNYILTV